MSFVQGFINSESSLNSFCTESQNLITKVKNRLEQRLSSGMVNGRQLYSFEKSNFLSELEHLNACIKACKKAKALYQEIKPQLLEIFQASDSTIALPIENAQELIQKITFIYNHLPRDIPKPYSCKRDQVQTIINQVNTIIPRSLTLKNEGASLRESSGLSLFASLPLSLDSPLTQSLSFNNKSLSSSFCVPSRTNLLPNHLAHTTLPSRNTLRNTQAATASFLQPSFPPSHAISLSSSVEGLGNLPSNHVPMNRSLPLDERLTQSERLPSGPRIDTPPFAEIVSPTTPENEEERETRLEPFALKKKVSLWKRLFNHTLTPLIGGGSMTLLSFVCLGFASSASFLVVPGLLGLAVGLPAFFLGILWNLLPRPKVNFP